MYMYVWCTSELPVSMKALKCKTLGAIIYRHHGIVINNVHVACACVNILIMFYYIRTRTCTDMGKYTEVWQRLSSESIALACYLA